jgi:hypothetical protein
VLVSGHGAHHCVCVWADRYEVWAVRHAQPAARHGCKGRRRVEGLTVCSSGRSRRRACGRRGRVLMDRSQRCGRHSRVRRLCLKVVSSLNYTAAATAALLLRFPSCSLFGQLCSADGLALPRRSRHDMCLLSFLLVLCARTYVLSASQHRMAHDPRTQHAPGTARTA